MRVEALEILFCPHCGGDCLKIDITEENTKEIVDGRLILLSEPSRGFVGNSARRRVQMQTEGGLNEQRYSIFS
jgi:uncharacterized protein YbaR (Trm112 family)